MNTWVFTGALAGNPCLLIYADPCDDKLGRGAFNRIYVETRMFER
jgi:hypothetical protein